MSKNIGFPYNKIVGGTLLVVTVLIIASHLYLIPEFYKSFLSIPLIFFIPLTMGHFCLFILKSIKSDLFLPDNLLISIIIDWSIGILCLTFLFFILSFLRLSAALIVSFVSLTILLLSTLIYLKTYNDNIYVKTSTLFWLFITIIFGGFLPFLYIRFKSIFPYQLGVDHFNHQVCIRDILDGTHFPRIFEASFEELISVIVILLNIDPLSIFWAAPLFQYLMFSIGIFIMVYKFSRDNILSFISTIIPCFSYGGAMLIDLIFFLRRNMLMSFFPFLVYTIYDSVKIEEAKDRKFFTIVYIFPIVFFPFLLSNYALFNMYGQHIFSPIRFLIWPVFSINPYDAHIGGNFSKLQDIYSLIVSTLIFIIISKFLKRKMINFDLRIVFVLTLSLYTLHYMMTFSIMTIIFLSMWTYWLLNYRIVKISKILSLITVLYLFINFVSELPFLKLALESFNELLKILNLLLYYNPDVYNFPFNWKKDFFEKVLGPVFSWLSLICVIVFPFIFKNNYKMFLIHIIICGTMLLYFAPLSFSYRWLMFFVPLAGYFCVTVLFETVKKVDRKILFKLYTPSFVITFPIVKILIVSLFLYFVSFSMKSYENYINYYKEVLYTEETGISLFQKEDLEVGNLIKAFPKESILITDPITLQIISGLSGLTKTFNERIFTSMTTTAPLYVAKEGLFKEILSNFSLTTLENLIQLFPNSLENKTILIIVNHRTSSWINNDEYYMYFKPFKEFPGFEKLLNNSHLTKIYCKNGYYVFKVE